MFVFVIAFVEMFRCLGYSISVMTLCSATLTMFRGALGTCLCAVGVAFTAVGEALAAVSPLAIGLGTFLVAVGSSLWSRTSSSEGVPPDSSADTATDSTASVPASPFPSGRHFPSEAFPPTIIPTTTRCIFQGPISGTGPSPPSYPLPSYCYHPPPFPSAPLAVYLSPEQDPRYLPSPRRPPRRAVPPTLTVVPCSDSEDELNDALSPSGAAASEERERAREEARVPPDSAKSGKRFRPRANALGGRSAQPSGGATPKRTTPRATID